MELAIVREPVEEAIEGGCLLLDPDRHQILGDYYWLEWCRGVSRNQRLAAYRHRDTGRVVLGVWAWSPREVQVPVMLEVEGFNGNPHALWPHDLLNPAVMEPRLLPTDAGDLEKRRRRAADKLALERSLKEENRLEKKIAARRLKKMGMEKEAYDLETGGVPFAGRAMAGDRVELWTEEIKRMLGR